MQTQQVLEKTIGAFEVRRQFGKVLTGVMTRGEKVVVERNGAPVAVVVPVHIYEQWKHRREAFFQHMRAAAQRSQDYQDLSEDDVTELVSAEIKAFRAEKRSKP